MDETEEWNPKGHATDDKIYCDAPEARARLKVAVERALSKTQYPNLHFNVPLQTHNIPTRILMGNVPYTSIAVFNTVCEINNVGADIRPELIPHPEYPYGHFTLNKDNVGTILQTTVFFNGPLSGHVQGGRREVPVPFRLVYPDLTVAKLLEDTDKRVFKLMISEGTLPAMLWMLSEMGYFPTADNPQGIPFTTEEQRLQAIDEFLKRHEWLVFWWCCRVIGQTVNLQ
ncbi:hypothetical protein GLAREA_03263 [Glarea lozoyensis ATCC 20868]|uniref:Uncharacterized protein n=1 Tax=Glarea lozoyensis (strain ATCC 20868 / MF5171) TaxID=1116229 RepID=S3DLC1_GLAL2|nr:uncharacterized protein GLAREA_03263 [Glarea lozoyensis ATCC 20868]EPE27348.1 hypothetical protein GLAREA_03263 [Glarea lozoyensis ATCC 20868]